MTEEEKVWVKQIHNDDGRIDGLRIQRIEELEQESAALRQSLEDVLSIMRAEASGAGPTLQRAHELLHSRRGHS